MHPPVLRAMALLYRVMHLHTRGIKLPDEVSNCCEQIWKLLEQMVYNSEKDLRELRELNARLDQHLDRY